MEDAMIACPACGSMANRVIKAGTGWRRRVCPGCESRWTTREETVPGSVWRKGDPIPSGRPVKQPPVRLVRNATPKVGSPEPPTGGGFSGNGIPVGVIDDSSSYSSFPLTLPVADPDQTQAHTRSEKRARKPSTQLTRMSDGTVTMAFTRDFLAFWEGIGFKRGHKEPAFRAYVKRGSPDPVKTADRWTQYVASLDDPKFAQHVATWLNAGGHLETYGPRKLAAVGGFVPSDYPEFD